MDETLDLSDELYDLIERNKAEKSRDNRIVHKPTSRYFKNNQQVYRCGRGKDAVANSSWKPSYVGRNCMVESHSREIFSKQGEYKREKVYISEGNGKERVVGLGYRSLKNMLSKDLTEMVIQLTSKKKEFCSLLEQNLQPEMIMLVVEILAKISDSSMKENKAALLAHSVRPNVLEMFSSHACDFVTKDTKYTQAEIFNHFQNLAIFYQDVVDILPNTATDLLKEHLIKTIMAVQSLQSMKNMSNLVEIEKKFNNLRSSVVSMLENRKSASKKKSNTESKFEWKPPGTDFREVSIFPLPQDVLLRSEVQLSPVIINGPYKSIEHYLNVQFHLLREDFLIPLREGIMNFVEQNSAKAGRLKRIENVRFYKGVTFQRQFVEGDTLVSEVLFDPRGRMENINWIRSKRLKYGSLVCFSSDLFETLFLGIIVNRDIEMLSRGILQCELIGDVKENLFGKEFSMAESEVYFEAYQHVLKALKNYNETNFPLKEYIINVSSEVVLPNYLALNPDARYNMEYYSVKVLDRNSWPRSDELKVNQSQLKALQSALTQKLAVIQGPPGTGKTYLGLIIANLLLENTLKWRDPLEIMHDPRNSGPILVVCYTNHALDQFLEGILKFTKNIVRVGSQSKNENMEKYNLKKIRQHYQCGNHYLKESAAEIKDTCAIIEELSKKAGIMSLKLLCSGMDKHHQEWFCYQGKYRDQYLVEWLLYGAYWYSCSEDSTVVVDTDSIPNNMTGAYACSLLELQNYILELKDEIAENWDSEYLHDALEINRNRFFYLKDGLMESACKDSNLISRLLDISNLDTVSYQYRWVLYNNWLSKSMKHYKNILSEQRENFQSLNRQKLEILDSINLDAMLQSDVVGITTTGAAKQQTLLQKLGAKIVHREVQLCLKVCLINKKVAEHCYRRLTGHNCEHYKTAKLRSANLPKAMDDTSKKNIEESQFLIALCRHIVLQGYDPSQITILTTYTGQMYCLMEERDKFQVIKEVQITCVDNYQGEENDIILLSLVRNNSEGKIGFLGTDNRVCVALSRAKKGLYIMGNIEILSAKSLLWGKVREVLEKKEAVGTHLTLQCLNHPSQLTKVSKADDFISIREGGCTLMCETKLHCGHICKKLCHMMGHNDYKCNETCGKRMCIQDHRCKKFCWENCGECMVPLEHELPCGHTAMLPCHVEPSEHKCQELVNMELPDCKHTITKRCYLDVKDAHCSFPCDSRLPCGHICEWKCHVKNDPEHLDYKCNRPCGRKNSGCKDEHTCQRKCYEECSRCTFKVKRQLPNCDHFYDMECWVDAGTIQCHKPCRKMLPCGHKCPLQCFNECGGCGVIVEKEIPGCKHKIKTKCCIKPESKICTMKCERLLNCGHICKNVCGIPCSEMKCMTLINETHEAPCGHEVKLFCSELHNAPDGQSLLKRCQEPCSTLLECSHLCKGTCGECVQGRIHIPCAEKCGKNLICGHSCTVSCSQSCRPCAKKCYIQCEHSKCRKKCGNPCSPCKEKCTWKCEHFQCNRQCGEMCDRPPCNEPCKKKLKCSHPCIGFCGEKCPPLCRICDADNIKEIITFLGSDDENARFVLLPDCKHIFDSKGLDKWMALDGNAVKMKVCPQCSTPIQNVYRFGNIIKQHFNNVLKVKYKVFGNMRNINDTILKSYLQLLSYLKDNFQESEEYLVKLETLIKKKSKKHFDGFVLNSLEARIQFMLSITEAYIYMKKKLTIQKIKECKDEVNFLIKKILKDLDFISPQEHSDLTNECTRFHLKLQLGVVQAIKENKRILRDEWCKSYQECEQIVYSVKPLTKELQESTREKIAELHKILTLGRIGLPKVEMNEIVRAISLHQGHWYMCPNGHVYVIDNCGNAMQEGICNECGEHIGGMNHRLLATNTRLNDIPEGI